MGNKHIYFNKSLNPGKLDDLEGIEHEDNEYSEHWEGTLVESGVGTESVVNKLKDKSSWCWYYDLKSAFHHISIIQKHRKVLGFRVVIGGEARVFRFVAMPFGYKDASRILTKVMRTPICRWRVMNIPSFIHIDDGLGFMRTKEEARAAAERVKEDLCQLGLVTSYTKCQWKSWSSG